MDSYPKYSLYFFAKDSPLYTLPIVTTKPSPTWIKFETWVLTMTTITKQDYNNGKTIIQKTSSTAWTRVLTTRDKKGKILVRHNCYRLNTITRVLTMTDKKGKLLVRHNCYRLNTIVFERLVYWYGREVQTYPIKKNVGIKKVGDEEDGRRWRLKKVGHEEGRRWWKNGISVFKTLRKKIRRERKWQFVRIFEILRQKKKIIK